MKSKDELRQDFLELSAEGADIAISLLTESELLRDIPVADLFYKLGKTLKSIPDVIFLHKLGRFIKTVNDKTTEYQRSAFAEDIKKNKDKRDKLYTAIFLKIDKFDDITKSDLFAKIFACFITNRIRQEDFTALSSALNLAILEDIKEFSKIYWEDRKFFYKKAYGLSGRDYGNLLSTKFVTITLDKSDKLRDIPSMIIHNVDFVITELGCLYAYISEDFENYFSFMDTSERSYPINEGKIYIFDTPSSNEELSLKVQQKFPPNR
ncbi:hypothetical protein [Nostoc commune]|uniref:hypothetical protein n=1 Tax=Nostoc commune TaxID=1178 RepID=UPI0018C74307|nr:hypothetical protein [Nostoc commune]MBG1260635.1 hypothetical protein [Nostoc commune BAE]